jgi:DNA-directed RNA polymerase specialized sigma24 family protein
LHLQTKIMAAKTSFTDYELVRAIHLDNKEVLDYLFETNFTEIRKYILANGGTDEQADIALQQAIVELWYQINHQQFKPEKDLKTYLFNLVKDNWNKGKKGAVFYNSIIDSKNQHYDVEVITNCIGIIEPLNRTVLCYHYFEGYDWARIATILNLEDKDISEKRFNEAKNQLHSLIKIRYPEIDKEKDLDKVISSGVCAYRYKELISFIKTNAAIPMVEKSFNMAWILILLVVILGGVGTWLYSSNFSIGNGEKKENLIEKKVDTSADESIKTKPKEKEIKYHQNKINQTIKDIDSMQLSALDTGKIMDEDLQIPKGKIQEVNSNGDIIIKEIIDTATNGDIVVKKDELLFTMYCKVVDKSIVSDTHSENKNKESITSTANQTAELLNPQAKLPNEEKKIMVYQVELWKSPVNYKGYKMQKNKIIIYGIEDTEMITLVSLDETIYLHSGLNFYMLIPSIDFRPFLKLKDKSILAELTK